MRSASPLSLGFRIQKIPISILRFRSRDAAIRPVTITRGLLCSPQGRAAVPAPLVSWDLRRL